MSNFLSKYRHKSQFEADIAHAIDQVSDVLNIDEIIEQLSFVSKHLREHSEDIKKEEIDRKERDDE